MKVIGFITVEEAARLRGCRRRYVLDLIRRGRLSAEVLFGQLLVRRSEVEKIVKGRPGRQPGRERMSARCAAGEAGSRDLKQAGAARGV